MGQPLLFWEVLEAADQLTQDEQEALLDILRRRIAAQAREAIARDIEESRQEFAEGKCKAITSIDEFMKEIMP